MTTKLQYSIIILLVAIPSARFSQQDSSCVLPDKYLIQQLEGTIPFITGPEQYDFLEVTSDDPVNINTAGLYDLLRVPFLGFSGALSILEHRRKYGPFFSTNELHSISDLSNLNIYCILPYLTTGNTELTKANPNNLSNKPNSAEDFHASLRTRISGNTLNNKAVTENNYNGSPAKIYNRIQLYNHSKYMLGLTFEKDAGEKSLTDFTSFYLSVRNFSCFNAIIVGDYSVQFGQGLALWGPYGFLKGSEAINNLHKPESSIIPYTGSDENRFFRGAALSIPLSNFTLTPFYSANRLDASVDTSTGKITSLLTSGYHRSTGELDRKDKVKESIYGLRVDYNTNDFRAGILYYNSEFSHSFLNEAPDDLSGNRFGIFSLSCKLHYEKLFFSGEAAFSRSKAAFINSLEIKLNKNISSVVSIRNYPSGFTALHSNAFGGSSGAANDESGVYTGLRIQSTYGKINIYFDQFRHVRTSSAFPSNGNDLSIDLSLPPVYDLKMSLRYRNGYEGIVEWDNISGKTERIVRTYRAEILYDFSHRFYLKSRIDFNNYNITGTGIKENGFAAYQETGLSSGNLFSFYARVTYFNTDSYYSRIFQMEGDVPGILVSTMLYGKGINWYVKFQYRPAAGLTLVFKYSEKYNSLRTASSGEDITTDGYSFQAEIKL
ncbi:MAG: helix-hairpin-helix domain-containing protein [Ignavibacteriales bacterium]